MTDKNGQEEFDVSSEFDFEDTVEVNMEDTHIEIFHKLGGNTLTLKYDGRYEQIFVSYTNKENVEIMHDFEKDYPQLDKRVISSIASVFIKLRYFGHDFYSGDFQDRLKDWFEWNVFYIGLRNNIDIMKYRIEEKSKELFDHLSEIRLLKCWNNDQFTPLIWASPEQIKKLYDHYKHCGEYK